MLGTIRFLLAIAVALSHANVRIAGLNPGVIAVVCFYLISGYVMTGLIRSHYFAAGRIGSFYLDRGLRILPQYLLICALTLAWYFNGQPHTTFLGHAPSAGDLLNNLAIAPLNYYMFNGSDSFTLIPPAWSLGAEVQFYLLIPLLLIWRLRSAALVLGGCVFAAACWGAINSEVYGYRLLPGVLSFFLLGSIMFDLRENRRSAVLLGVTLLATLAGALLLAQGGHLGLPYNRETLIGLALGLPLLFVFGRLPQHALDNRLGDLSYGVFLNHFLIQWTVTGVPTDAAGWALYLVSIIVLSAVTQWLVERPVLAWKRRLRKKSDAETGIALGQPSAHQ
jgi:peptidoglycan/LPS O-acetylase OafA/YrhL